MKNQTIKEYYEQKFTKLGYDLYRIITYLPFRFDKISPNLNLPADLYFVTGKIIKEEQKSKYTLINVMTKAGMVIFFDFGKKIIYLKDKNTSYQFLLKKSNEYLSLVDLSALNSSYSEFFVLGSLQEKIYYRPIYNSLSYQIRSKQISLYHQQLTDSNYILNLTGLVPKSDITFEVINLKSFHKPVSLEEYDQTLRIWNNFQSFLHLCFLNNIDNQKKIEQTLVTKYPTGMLKLFENKIGYNLSNSQRQAINQILDNITYGK